MRFMFETKWLIGWVKLVTQLWIDATLVIDCIFIMIISFIWPCVCVSWRLLGLFLYKVWNLKSLTCSKRSLIDENVEVTPPQYWFVIQKVFVFFLLTTIHWFKIDFCPCFVAFAWRVETRNQWYRNNRAVLKTFSSLSIYTHIYIYICVCVSKHVSAIWICNILLKQLRYALSEWRRADEY